MRLADDRLKFPDESGVVLDNLPPDNVVQGDDDIEKRGIHSFRSFEGRFPTVV